MSVLTPELVNSDITGSPVMPSLVLEIRMNFSSAQWNLPVEALSVTSSDIDLSVFDLSRSVSASASLSASVMSLLSTFELEPSTVPSVNEASCEPSESTIVGPVSDAISESLLPYYPSGERPIYEFN